MRWRASLLPIAFEPIEPPKRQISRQPPPAREPALWGWSVIGEGGTHAHTSWALTTSSPTAVRAVAVRIPRFCSVRLTRHRARARRGASTTILGESLMHGFRYDRILAGTALALILAIPMVGLAQDPNKAAPAPTTASPAEQVSTPTLAADPAAVTEQPVAVTEQAAPVDPLASLDPADRVIAEKIRDLLAATSDKIFASKKERAAAEAFYQNRNFLPLWLDKGVENARATSAIARLKHADGDGLEVSDYKTPSFAGLGNDASAEAELKLTQAVLTYARHVQAGRFAYTRVSRNIELPQAVPEPADILGTIAAASDAG